MTVGIVDHLEIVDIDLDDRVGFFFSEIVYIFGIIESSPRILILGFENTQFRFHQIRKSDIEYGIQGTDMFFEIPLFHMEG